MRRVHARRSAGWSAVAMGLVLGLSASAVTAASPPKLRYGHQKGQEFCYEVKIAGELPDEEHTREGILTYTVSSSDEKQFVLKAAGHLKMSSKFKDRSRILGPYGFGWGFRRISIGINLPMGIALSRTGTVIEEGWGDYLPFLLGEEEVLVIEPLPDEPQAEWHKETELRVVEYIGAAHFYLRGTKTGAKERNEYAILEQKGDTVRIGKKYLLQTAEDKGIRYIDMSGTGELEFDLKRGVMTSLSMTYKILVNEKNITMTVPVTLSYRMLNDAEMAEHKKKLKEDADARAEAARPKPFEAGERERLLADLRVGDEKRVKAAAQRLAKTIPDDKTAEVSAALAVAIKKETDNWVLAELLKAAKVWPSPELEKPLIASTKSSHFPARNAAVEALGKYKTKAAAEAVAAQIFHCRKTASDALREIGKAAEPVALSLLDDRDYWVRSEAYRILGEVGGKESLAALKKRGHKVQFQERRAYDDAIEALTRRSLSDEEDDEDAAESKADKTETTAASGLRTWHDATRSFSIEATFVSHVDGKVTLQRKDGRKITLPCEKLCDEDQEFVKKQPKPTNPFE